MTITYPLTMPTTPAPKQITFSSKFAVAGTESPFTYQQEVFEHQGQAWLATVQLPPMKRAEAEAWVAFGLSLNGTLGTFLMGDPINTSPQGAGTGTPLIDGAGQQASKTLATKGWTNSTLVLKAGDFIQLGNYLYKNLTDATSDSSGKVTLNVFPRIRDALADGQVITISNTKGIWRLTDNSWTWDIQEAQIYGIAFECREAI